MMPSARVNKKTDEHLTCLSVPTVITQSWEGSKKQRLRRLGLQLLIFVVEFSALQGLKNVGKNFLQVFVLTGKTPAVSRG
jgi:hypothetical protein